MRKPGEVDVEFVAITLADGSLAIMQFVVAEYGAGGKPRWTRPATSAAIEVEIARTRLPCPAAFWRRIAAADIPPDRAFRDAWVDAGGRLDHDLVKVRAIALQRLRQKRDQALAALDVQTMQAVGAGDDKRRADVEGQKQFLRDMPQRLGPRLQAATTVQEIARIGLED